MSLMTDDASINLVHADTVWMVRTWLLSLLSLPTVSPQLGSIHSCVAFFSDGTFEAMPWMQSRCFQISLRISLWQMLWRDGPEPVICWSSSSSSSLQHALHFSALEECQRAMGWSGADLACAGDAEALEPLGVEHMSCKKKRLTVYYCTACEPWNSG